MGEPDEGHEFLEHTADAGFRVWAPDLSRLFARAAGAMFGLMGRAPGPEAGSAEVTLSAPDLEALLVDWLSELLFVFEVRGFVPEPVDIEVDEDAVSLRARVAGPSAAELVQDGPQVKAVTYHDLQVRRTASGWEARVYVDV